MNWKTRFKRKLNKQSVAELILHAALQKRGIGAKRNRPITGISGKCYFLDLYIQRAMLGIELDGPEHDEIKDAERDADIIAAKPRRKIMRFKNSDIYTRLGEIVNKIYKYVGDIPAKGSRRINHEGSETALKNSEMPLSKSRPTF